MKKPKKVATWLGMDIYEDEKLPDDLAVLRDQNNRVVGVIQIPESSCD